MNRAFKFYELGTAATKGCDDVARSRCGTSAGMERFQQPGSVLGCLQRGTANVSDACWMALSATLEEVQGLEVKAARMEKTIAASVEAKVYSEVKQKLQRDSIEILEDSQEAADSALRAAARHVDTTTQRAAHHESTVRALTDNVHTLAAVVSV